MGRALDTFTRFVMLVLAGLVSLSIIGAIASMSSGGAPGAGAPQPAVRPLPVEAQPQARTQAAPEGSRQGSGGVGASTGAGEAVLVEAAPETRDQTARWLEAIAYALMAIVGLLALIALILWRGLRGLTDRQR